MLTALAYLWLIFMFVLLTALAIADILFNKKEDAVFGILYFSVLAIVLTYCSLAVII